VRRALSSTLEASAEPPDFFLELLGAGALLLGTGALLLGTGALLLGERRPDANAVLVVR
jgi:hypothetical protein